MFLETALAAVGGILVIAVLRLWSRDHTLVIGEEGKPFQRNSESTSRMRTTPGYGGFGTDTTWSEEVWTWRVEGGEVVGKGGRLQLQCRIWDHSLYEAGEIDSGICESRKRERETIRAPCTVKASGNVTWHSDRVQATSANHESPLKWEWIFDAKEPGDKIIQLELPYVDGLTTRHVGSGDTGDYEYPDSKFINITVKTKPVPGVFGLTGAWEKSVLAIIAFIALGLCAPIVVKAVELYVMKADKEQPEKPSLPTHVEPSK